MPEPELLDLTPFSGRGRGTGTNDGRNLQAREPNLVGALMPGRFRTETQAPAVLIWKRGGGGRSRVDGRGPNGGQRQAAFSAPGVVDDMAQKSPVPLGERPMD